MACTPLFLLFLLLFVRLLPVLSMHELRKLIRQMEGKQDEQAQGEAGHG